MEQTFSSVSIKRSGLVIDKSNHCLACSPDGIVTYIDKANQQQTGIVEYKCPYSLAQMNLTPSQGCTASKTYFCSLKDGSVQLKRKHDYFYQVQGTIAITGLAWCDFVVWTPQGISVERIAADKHFWEGLKDILLLFYHKALLPELAVPRHTSKQPIQEPFLSQ